MPFTRRIDATSPYVSRGRCRQSPYRKRNGEPVGSLAAQTTVGYVSRRPRWRRLALRRPSAKRLAKCCVSRSKNVFSAVHYIRRDPRRSQHIKCVIYVRSRVALHGGEVPPSFCRPACCCCLVSLLTLTLCTWAYTMHTRSDLRQKYGLAAEPCADCLVHLW